VIGIQLIFLIGFFLAKEKLAKVADDVKASGKKNILLFSMMILDFV
jgi:hypothetical protein